jgi:hypothetical protein
MSTLDLNHGKVQKCSDIIPVYEPLYWVELLPDFWLIASTETDKADGIPTRSGQHHDVKQGRYFN